jgi:hypothetical protein
MSFESNSCEFNRVQQMGRRLALGLLFALLTAGCSRQAPPAPRVLQIQQTWELQPGDRVAGHRVAGGLGDISIELKGDSVYAPAPGLVQPNVAGCVVFSSADIPAYLFRLCGLSRPKLGEVQQGEAIGAGNYLEFAALRRQPDGKWAMVEPSTRILERTLKP